MSSGLQAERKCTVVVNHCLQHTGTCMQVVLLFSDTQIKDESFVEDLSNLLNTYEVPNLMSAGDLGAIFENLRPRAKQAGMDGDRDQLYNFFNQEVRRNLHIVLSFSPVGDAFRERLRKFPSLINCTTIDWFTAWPRDGLATVATNFLAGLPGVDEKVAKALPALCVKFHEDVQALSARFLAEQHRHYYVTPTSYLELLGSYKRLLANRQDEVRQQLAPANKPVSMLHAHLSAQYHGQYAQ
eukprot:GHRR01034129.1.p1 GENE.GHRR01034129.1~~GHRR01034129.1.p1  ORF type:complete len:241 (+),score=67.11 GHRR01034129.1:69-791(+)